MFKLAEQRGGSVGLYYGAEGLFLGPSPMIARVGAGYRIRDENEIRGLLAAAYGSPVRSTETLAPRLPLIREALEQGDLCRAAILAVQAQLSPMAPEGIERLAHVERLAKYNFNPDEPRDGHGRWTGLEDGAQTDATATGDHPALIPVQELLPFGVRPPLFFDEPPETIRPFKETVPRLSGKEAAKDAPSWARGQRPYVGENGRDFAKRLMDQRYGRGNWKPTDPEYRRIQKYGDRHFRDPRAILLPDDGDHI